MNFWMIKWLGFLTLMSVFCVSTAEAQVADPTLSVTGGTSAQTVSVTVSESALNSTIYYTTNGTNPTTSSSTIVSGQALPPLNVGATLKVQAYVGTTTSNVVTAVYTTIGIISSSGDHTVLLKPDGTVNAWGNGSSGQIGNGGLSTVNKPTLVTSLTGVNPVVSLTVSTGQPIPISGLSLWLRADAGVITDGNGNVTTWKDQTTNQNNALPYAPTATTGRATVLTNSLNGQPVIHFMGTTGANSSFAFNDNSSLRPSSGVTVISVVRPTANSLSFPASEGYNSSYGLAVNGTGQLFEGGIASGTSSGATLISSSNGYTTDRAYLAVDVYDGAHQTLYIAGQQAAQVAQTGAINYPTGSQPFYLGYNIGPAQVYYTGDIAEVLVYNRALTSSELLTVQGYLADKWGVYAPNATWFNQAAYVNIKNLIATYQWTKTQADAFVQKLAANSSVSTDLVLWYKADAGITTDGSGNVTGWQDQSIYGSIYQNTALPYSPTSTTGRATVSANSLNGQPVVHLNGAIGAASSFVLTDNQTLRPTSGVTVVSVLRPTANALSFPVSEGYNSSYGSTVTGSMQTFGGGIASGTNPSAQVTASITSYAPDRAYVEANVYDGTNQTVYLSGQQVAQTPQTGSIYYPSGPQPFYLGYNIGPAQVFYTGDLAEVLVYDRALTAGELLTVQGYLGDKWGVYAPGATWPQNNGYSSAEQTLIATYKWNKSQADAFAQKAVANPSVSTDLVLWYKADTGVTTDGSGNVTGWQDQSLYGSIYPNTAAPMAPTVMTGRATVLPSSLNGEPVVHMPSPTSTASSFSFTDNQSLRPTSGVTVVSVLRPTDSTPLTFPVAEGYNSSYGIAANANAQTFSAGIAAGSSSSAQIVSSTAPSLPDRPYLVANVYDGTNETLYVTGQQAAQSPKTGAINYSAVNGPQPFYLGNNIGPAQVYYNGDIAEVMVYSRALSANELQGVWVYLSGKYGFVAAAPPTIAGTAGGNYTGSATITFNTAPSGAIIRYTLDGTQPKGTSPVYGNPITLTGSAPITYAYFVNTQVVSPSGTAQYYVNDSGQIGISDAWQNQYFGHTGINPNADPLNSGLTYLQKYLLGYNPLDYSTNGDGLSDGTNYALGYSGSNTDINNYGLTNAQQLALGLDPFDTGINPPLPTPPASNPGSPPVITIDLPTNTTPVP